MQCRECEGELIKHGYFGKERWQRFRIVEIETDRVELLDIMSKFFPLSAIDAISDALVQ